MKNQVESSRFHSINGRSFLNESPLVYFYVIIETKKSNVHCKLLQLDYIFLVVVNSLVVKMYSQLEYSLLLPTSICCSGLKAISFYYHSVGPQKSFEIFDS